MIVRDRAAAGRQEVTSDVISKLHELMSALEDNMVLSVPRFCIQTPSKGGYLSPQ